MTQTLKTPDQVDWLRDAATHVAIAFDRLERMFDGLDQYGDADLVAAYDHALAIVDRFNGYVLATVQLHSNERPD